MTISKRQITFRITVAILMLVALLVRALNFIPAYELGYMHNAQELLGSIDAATSQFRIMQSQRVFDQVYIFVFAILFYILILRPVDRLNRWWLIFPLLILTAAVLGILQSHIDRFINNHFYISFLKGLERDYIQLNLTNLKSKNFFNLVSVFLTASTVYHLEKILFLKGSPVKSIRFSFWLGTFVISLAIVSLFFLGQITSSITMAASVLPLVIILALALTMVSVFFMDTFIEDHKFSFKRSLNKFLKVLLSSLGVLGLMIIFLFKDPGFYQAIDEFSIRILIFSGLIVLVMSSLTYVIYRSNMGEVRTAFKLKADLQKSSSELNFLKSQVNPHFLFNSLNTLYGIALQEESLRTADGIQKLSDMMRFMLRENTADKIPLTREIDYINNYIDLQSLRITGASDIDLNIDIAEACTNHIAPMLLIPFIENAFKHGVSMQEASLIKVKLVCDSQSLKLEVQNTLHQQQPKSFEESGIGIENVKKRLEILYPNAHDLKIKQNEERYEVMLKIMLI